jgi:hypothetical protein
MKLTKEQKYGIVAIAAAGLIWYLYKNHKENSTKINWDNAKKVGVSTTILEGKLLGKKVSTNDIKKMEDAYDAALPQVKETYSKLGSEEQKAIAWAFNYAAKKLNSSTDLESAKKFDDGLNAEIKKKFPNSDIDIITNFMKNGK